MNHGESSGRWFRFSLGHLVVLVTGIVIGMVSIRPWELGVSATSQLIVEIELVDVAKGSLDELGIEQSMTDKNGVLAREKGSRLKDGITKLAGEGFASRLAAPSIITTNGREASFQAGGAIPIPVVDKAGNAAVEMKDFGTKVTLLPTILRNGRIRLEISTELTEVSSSKTNTVANGQTVPSFHTRSLQADVELANEETLIVGGLPNSGPSQDQETLFVATVRRVADR